MSTNTNAPVKHKSISYAKWGYLFISPFFVVYAKNSCVFDVSSMSERFISCKATFINDDVIELPINRTDKNRRKQRSSFSERNINKEVV